MRISDWSSDVCSSDLLAAVKDKAIKPEEGLGGPADTAVGDFAGAFASATIKLDQLYSTPDQSHSMMEPHATTAAWNNDKLTIWTSNQMIAWAVGDLAQTLRKIGRASYRERVCQYVEISLVAGALKKNKKEDTQKI